MSDAAAVKARPPRPYLQQVKEHWIKTTARRMILSLPMGDISLENAEDMAQREMRDMGEVLDDEVRRRATDIAKHGKPLAPLVFIDPRADVKVPGFEEFPPQPAPSGASGPAPGFGMPQHPPSALLIKPLQQVFVKKGLSADDIQISTVHTPDLGTVAGVVPLDDPRLEGEEQTAALGNVPTTQEEVDEDPYLGGGSPRVAAGVNTKTTPEPETFANPRRYLCRRIVMRKSKRRRLAAPALLALMPAKLIAAGSKGEAHEAKTQAALQTVKEAYLKEASQEIALMSVEKCTRKVMRGPRCREYKLNDGAETAQELFSEVTKGVAHFDKGWLDTHVPIVEFEGSPSEGGASGSTSPPAATTNPNNEETWAQVHQARLVLYITRAEYSPEAWRSAMDAWKNSYRESIVQGGIARRRSGMAAITLQRTRRWRSSSRAPHGRWRRGFVTGPTEHGPTRTQERGCRWRTCWRPSTPRPGREEASGECSPGS